VRLASLPWYDLREVHDAHDALWDRLARRLRDARLPDVPSQLERNLDYVTQWHSGRLLLGQACGYDVATWQSETLQIVATPRFGFDGCEGHQYRSFVVVHRDDAAQTLDELRGRRCAINGETSHSGMNALQRLLGDRSRDEFFARVVVSGAHEHSARMVSGGEADVAAIDCITYGLLAKHRPTAVADLRILCETDRAPAPPFVTAASTSREEVETLREILDEVLADRDAAAPWSPLQLRGISRLRPSDYATLRPRRRA
jgi:ABC-type phosphate/phosphonate transport system substrate-binding protein